MSNFNTKNPFKTYFARFGAAYSACSCKNKNKFCVIHDRDCPVAKLQSTSHKKTMDRQANFDKKMLNRSLQAMEMERALAIFDSAMNYQENGDSQTVKFLSDNEYWIKLIEDVFILFYHFCRVNSSTDMIVAIANFAKLRSGKAIFSSDNIKQLENYAKSLFVSNIQTENKNWYASLKEGLKNYEMFKNSPVYQKLYKFITYALALSLFEPFGIKIDKFYSKVEAEAIKKKHHMGTDFIHCLLSTFTFLCDRGAQCMKTGNMDPIFHSSSEYDKFFELYTKLKRESTLLCNPAVHGIDVFTHYAEVKDAIEKGDAMLKYSYGMDPLEKRLMAKVVNDIKLLDADELTKRSARSSRTAPFAVSVFGGSSIGKSTFTEILFLHFGKMFDLPTQPEFKYTRNANSKYWDGFSTYQWCLNLDDIAFMHPDIAKAGGDPSLMEVIMAVNQTCFVPDQADLSDKGRTPMKCDLVIGSTNTPHLNAHHYYSCPIALMRRLPFLIDLKVKQEYADDDGMLDTSKVPAQLPGSYVDVWEISLFKITTVPSKNFDDRIGARGAYKLMYKFDNIYKFLSLFGELAKKHRYNQGRVKESVSMMQDLKLCAKCNCPENHCLCDSLQGTNIFDQSKVDEEVVIGDGEKSDSEDEYSEEEEQPSQKQYNRMKWLQRRPQAGFNANFIELTYDPRVTALTSILNMKTDRDQNNDLRKAIGDMTWKEVIFLPLTLVFCYLYFSSTWIGFLMNCIVPRFMINWFLYHKVNRGRYWRMGFRYIGYRIQRKINVHWKILSVVSLLTGSALFLYTLKNIFSKYEGEIQSKDEENTVCDENGFITTGSAPEPTSFEKINPWYKDDYVTTTLDLTNVSRSFQGKLSDFDEMISRRCGHFIFTFKGMSRYARGINVKGHYWLFNHHSLPDLDVAACRVAFSTCHQLDGINPNYNFLISCGDFKRFPDQELALVEIKQLPPGPDITKFFCEETLRGGHRGYYLGRNEDGTIWRQTIERISFSAQCYLAAVQVTVNLWTGKTNTPTKDGQCGSVLISETNNGPVILGIHVIGEKDDIGSLQVSRQFLQKNLQSFQREAVSSGEPKLNSGMITNNINELHTKSPVRYIEEGSAVVHGTFDGFRRGGKSSVRKTLLCQSMEKRGYELKYGAPVMKGWLPWRTGLVDMVKPATKFDTALLNECVLAFTNDILSALPKSELAEIKVYDTFTAINGAVGVSYVDRMNCKSSMGFPWRKSKKHFVEILTPQRGFNEPITFSKEIIDRSNNIELTYLEGKRAHPVFTGCLKDEALSFKKINIGKTRIFTCAPGDWSIVVRKYCLAFTRVMQRNGTIFEAAPGTIAQSAEWEMLYHYLVQFGCDRMVAGDYKAFDKSMPAVIIQAAFDIIYNVSKAAGFTEADLLVLRGIQEDTSFPLIDMNGDVISFYGSNPSGHPLTVIINSLANSLYIRYAYLLSGHDVNNFKKDVALLTYGDDNAMGISKKCHNFDHTVIQKILESLDITYTMADKESASVPFIHIDDISFLKRRWVYDKDVGGYLAPLEEDSIIKSLMIGTTSNTVTRQEQTIEIISSAVREYFFYGKEVFETKKLFLQELVIENDLTLYVNPWTFPTWDELVKNFWDNSQHVDLDSLRKSEPQCFNTPAVECNLCSSLDDDAIMIPVDENILCLDCILEHYYYCGICKLFTLSEGNIRICSHCN